jgi:sporulation protein YlmC with PRC-barrel domain
VKLFLSLISGYVFVGAWLSLAPDVVPPPAPPPMAGPAMPQACATTTPVLYYTRTLRGVPVRTPDGMPLGVMADLVLDPADARILMVIVVARGRLDIGGRFMALPWGLVEPVADGTALVVSLTPAPLRFPPDEEGLEAASPPTLGPSPSDSSGGAGCQNFSFSPSP